MYQQITIVGNVGQDPDTRWTDKGKQVTNFSVAVNDGYGDNQTTIWFKIAAWEKVAESCAKYVKKGMKVLVVGRVRVNQYTGQDGVARANLEITAQSVTFLSRVEDGPNVQADEPQGGNNDIPF